MNLDLHFYWKLFLRRFPIMALLVIVCLGLGVITALKTPETYQTSARLLVEAPQIPDSMVASTVQVNAVEQLDIIEQRLMTRANLIDIANRFNVFPNMRSMQPDEVLMQMRRSTSIRRTAGRQEATLMTISFTARSGGIAADVVNQYVTLVLEANSDFRVSRAENTLDFFEQEVQRLNEEMNRRSMDIVRFKTANANALPENQNFRLNRQNILQERLSRLERDLSQLTKQREDIIRIYEATGQITEDGQTRPSRQSPEEARLAAAKLDLDNALTIYSDTSPQVRQLKLRIERLEQAVAEQNRSDLEEAADAISPQAAIFETTLAEIDGRIELYQRDIDDTREALDELALAISQSSANDIELSTLEREFNRVKERYDAAVSNLNEAQMSERIESTAQGQRISVIESASVPNRPAGPNRIKIIAVAAIIGGGLAAGYFMLLEFLNSAIRRPAEITSRFEIVPLATIPYMESSGARLLRRAGLVLASLVVLIGTPAALWYIDTYYLPLELVIQRGLEKLGIG